MATLDVEKLIADIALRPAIWDKNFNGRQNKSFLEDTWDELAEIHNAPKKILKAKWKGLRDNFRIQWKMIPRDENDLLLIAPEDFTGTKWQYYKHLTFLADNMGKSRNSYSSFTNSMDDDQNYDLLQQFEPAIEIPSDDEEEEVEEMPKFRSQRSSITQYQQQLQQQHHQQQQHQQQQLLQQKQPPKLRAIPQLKMVDVQSLIGRQIAQTTITPSPVVSSNNLHQTQLSSKPISSVGITTTNGNKRKHLDEVTTTNGGNSSHISSNEEYPSASSPNLPNSYNDDDYHFLMSLQPYLLQFSGPQKLRVRMRIQKLIFKELYKDDIDDEK
ncbi:unnamed protein product [Diamesa hyperborea]